MRNLCRFLLFFSVLFVVLESWVHVGSDLQLPLAALGAIDPAVGLGVVDEFFFVRIPLEWALEPVGEVAQVADGDRAAADFDIADSLPA